MKHASPYGLAGSRGYTLVESIIVLVVLSIAAVGIISMQANIFKGRSDNRNIEVGVQLMQECAEQILATRQHLGYANVNANTCDTLGNYGVFDGRSVNVTPDNAGVCPSGGTCKKVVIYVSKAGVNLTPVTLELVSY